MAVFSGITLRAPLSEYQVKEPEQYGAKQGTGEQRDVDTSVVIAEKPYKEPSSESRSEDSDYQVDQYRRAVGQQTSAGVATYDTYYGPYDPGRGCEFKQQHIPVNVNR